MQRLLRIVLMSLLVLAIPVKGFAAAGMLAPAASHAPHHAAGVMPESAAVHEHEHESVHDHEHEHGHANAHGYEAMGHGDPSHDGGFPAAPDKPSCSSVCGACCVAAGMSASVASLPASPELADARPEAKLLALLRLCIGGLDRPPRLLLA